MRRWVQDERVDVDEIAEKRRREGIFLRETTPAWALRRLKGVLLDVVKVLSSGVRRLVGRAERRWLVSFAFTRLVLHGVARVRLPREFGRRLGDV